MLPGIKWRGLRTRIIGWSFVPTAIILALVAWTILYAYQQVTEDLVLERNQELARLSAGQLAVSIAEYSDLLEAVSRTSDMASSDPVAQRQALLRAANRLVVFDGGVVVLDHLGRVSLTEPVRTEIYREDWSGRSYFRQMVRSPGPKFSDILPDGPAGREVMSVAVPIMGPEGGMAGVLVGMFRLDATAISAFYGGIVKLRIGGHSSYLVDSQGRVIYHTDHARIGDDLSTDSVVQRVLSGEVGNVRTEDRNGRAILAGFAPVPGTSWGLVTEENWSSLMAASRGYRQFLMILLALGIVVPVLVVTVGMRRITRPIHELIRAAQEVAGGKFDQSIHADTGDELEELATQFNRMSAQLQESYAHLEERVAHRTRELATLNAIAAAVSHSLDLQEILEDALDKLVEVTGFDMGAAFSVETSGEGPEAEPCLVLKAQRYVPEEIKRLIERMPIGGLDGTLVPSQGRPNVRSIGDYSAGAEHDALERAGIAVVIRTPLEAKGRLLGAINLASRSPRLPGDEEISLLAAIGQQISVAMENARLYEEAEEAAAAAERSRLARDLHDAVTQTLFSASLIAEVLPRIWERNEAEGRRRLEELRQLTRGALAEMRTLLLELRPSALTEVPLADLLRQLVESTTGRARVPVSLTVEGEGDLPPDVRVVFYRIAQEALNNVAKHSGATSACVTLNYAGVVPPSVHMCVRDNGQGFIPHSVTGDHLGLGIMRERAQAISAAIQIESEPGCGTSVLVLWPSLDE